MDENIIMIVSSCQRVVQSWQDYNRGHEPNSKKVLKEIDTLEIVIQKVRKNVAKSQVDLMK